jgi:serine/threonine protein kinase
MEGVAYLHARRITHRDLKLENLLLADANDLSSIRLADFGLARAWFEDPSGDEAANPMCSVCGTPAFGARTQLRAHACMPSVLTTTRCARLHSCA